MRSPGRALALGVLGTALLVAATASGRKLHRARSVQRACEATSAGDWPRALALSESLPGHDPDGRDAATCRCVALAATGRADECGALVEGLLAHTEGRDWIPPLELSRVVIERWRSRGDFQRAAGLARAAGRRYPEDGMLQYLEFTTRSAAGDEAGVLADLSGRLRGVEGGSWPLRLLLASAWRRKGDDPKALAALGDTPPAAGDPARDDWFRARMVSAAALGDGEALRGARDGWVTAGGDPALAGGWYAAYASKFFVPDPSASYVALLRTALVRTVGTEDPDLREFLYVRLVGHLADEGARDEAVAVYDAARAEGREVRGADRADLLRSRSGRDLGEVRLGAERGTLRFRVTPPTQGGALAVSPDAGAPVDADFEEVALGPGGQTDVARAPSDAPQRWVFRDADGRVRASGTAWPEPGRTLDVAILLRDPLHEAAPAPQPRPPSGSPRVFVIVLDAGDWRLVQYLRARGELPVLDGLIRSGLSGVLTSRPAYTAAAMRLLTHPGGQPRGVVGLVEALGGELTDYTRDGRNPFGPLSWFVPESGRLFENLGSRDHVVANMLFAVGNMKSGRNGTVLGPFGRGRPPLAVRGFRPITQAEIGALPGIGQAADPAHRTWIEEVAAAMDLADGVADAGEVDLLALRLEPLDTLTHALFAECSRTAQDDASSLLFWLYRYIDRRLGGLRARLDEDDVLVVMSDHGIRTAMEHSEQAVLVISGGGVPPARIRGEPHLAGVPRVLADLLGERTDWPDTGILRRAER